MLLFTLIFSLAAIASSTKSYDNYKIYEISTDNDAQNAILKKLQDEAAFHLDFWSPLNKVGFPVHITVSPKIEHTLFNILNVFNVNYSIPVKNAAHYFQLERSLFHPPLTSRSLNNNEINFDRFLSYNDIEKYLAFLSVRYPDKVRMESIGKTYQGREMFVIRISSSFEDSNNKAKIFVEAGVHAREWISPATALYLIHQLSENATNKYLIDNIEWIILTNLNPDGYEKSRELGQRFWRKSVSPNKGFSCLGTDINRNFDVAWDSPVGASTHSCDETYKGSSPFSEIESRNLRDFILKTDNIKVYHSLHSYGQFLIYPWTYSDLPADNAEELRALTLAIQEAIYKVRGTEYIAGTVKEVIGYVASGSTVDWAKSEGEIPLALVQELPGPGFDINPDRIIGIAKETFEGFKALHAFVVNKYL